MKFPGFLCFFWIRKSRFIAEIIVVTGFVGHFDVLLLCSRLLSSFVRNREDLV